MNRIWNLGHRNVLDILDGDVVIQEKIDGSFFQATVRDGQLLCRSKGAPLELDAPPNLFAPAVETFKALHADGKLIEGWTYRGEALFRPKHNTIKYDRAPVGGVILFDVDQGQEDFLTPPKVAWRGQELGLEVVETYYSGHPDRALTQEKLDGYLTRESALGGAKIEGVVIKAYGRYGEDGHTMMAKYVSAAFKEAHRCDWKVRNPNRNDVVQAIIDSYATEARWRKAIQHLRERGELKEGPEDIGPLLREVSKDVMEECGDEIREVLFRHFWKTDIARGVTRGLPGFYKDLLAQAAFEEEAA